MKRLLTLPTQNIRRHFSYKELVLNCWMLWIQNWTTIFSPLIQKRDATKVVISVAVLSYLPYYFILQNILHNKQKTVQLLQNQLLKYRCSSSRNILQWDERKIHQRTWTLMNPGVHIGQAEKYFTCEFIP